MLGLAASVAHADDVTTLVAATAKHDTAAIRRILHDPVAIDGLWFTDEDCALAFDHPRDVAGKTVGELARCLAKLDLATSQRQTSLLGGAVVVAKPGIELAVVFEDHAITRIGYVAPGSVPTMSWAWLESQRLAGTRDLPLDTARRVAVERWLATSGRSGRVWMIACIDSGGVAVRSVAITNNAGLDAEASTAIASWRFKPIKLGIATPVAAVVAFDYPRNEPAPVDNLPAGIDSDACAPAARSDNDRAPPPWETVASTVLEPMRIAGDKIVTPDDVTRTEILRSGKSRVVAIFKLCLETDGTARDVDMLRSSGFPAYDQKIGIAMNHWAYKPYSVKGKNVPVCTRITFVYSQN